MTGRKTAICASLVLALTPAAAFAAVTGPAATTVKTYVQKTKIPCFRQFEERKCTIASMAADLDGEPSIFYGDNLAVVFLAYQYDNTGNAMDQMAIVLRSDRGKWSVIGRANNTIGTNPRNVKFSGDTISYVGTVVRDGDSRANPTGKGQFKLTIGPNGVKFVR